MYTLDRTIMALFDITREHEDMPATALTIKLSEEVGEFSEVMLHEMGYLRHKDKVWKDTPISEAADIINVLIGTLSVHYPDTPTSELFDQLRSALIVKGKKYAKLIGVDGDLST